jgi:glycosyltransferase involved in cell wall biosynthesis
MTTCVVLDGARTPIGKLLGVFSTLSAVDLGGIAIKAAVERSGVTADQIDAVVFGNVVQAGVGPNPARQCAAAAGLPIVLSAAAGNVREVVEVPQTGFVIRDPADPSEALCAVLSASDTQLAEMGARAAELARTQFDATAVARSLVQQLYP